MSLPPTIQAPPDFMDKHPERTVQWGDIVRSDPRRAVRVLTLRGPNAETVDGDTSLDSIYVISQLRELSKDSKSNAWKALVNAGVITALCKCALNFQAAIMHNNDAKLTRKEAESVAKEMLSPYFIPLEILTNAIVSCPMPPTSTEMKAVEEIKNHWSPIMQRVWSEPAYTLEATPKHVRILERIVVAQLFGKLTIIDSSFIDVLFKPADLTLAVIFRFWMHSTTVGDTRMNLSIILPLLQPPPPRHWQAQFEKHPPPPISALLPRLLLGASKTAGSDKKKRTPGQAADAIVSASAAHFEALDPADVTFDYNFFHALFNHSEKDNRAFNRAVYKSSKFWAANAYVMRRVATEASPVAEDIFMAALMTYSTMIHVVQADGREFVDALVYNWLSTGLFDALETSVDVLMKAARGPMVLTGIVAALDRWMPQLSAKTRTLLRSHLPRPRLIKRMLVASSLSGNEARAKMDSDYEDFVKRGSAVGARNSMWVQGAWQMLAVVSYKVEEPGQCARRGCDKLSGDPDGPQHVCEMCKIVKYCSRDCLDRDHDEHTQICGWMHVIEETCRQTKTTEQAQSASVGPSKQAAPKRDLKPEVPTDSMRSMTLADLD